jgi:hypothetical protein
MNLLTWSAALAAGLGMGLTAVLAQDTNAPAAAAATQVVAAAAATAPESWTGFVRTLKDPKGDLRAVKLVADDRLLAVDLTPKGRELGQMPKTLKLQVSGSLEERDGRPWLIVTDFKEAPAVAPEPAPTPVPEAAAPSTNAPAAAPASTNAPAPDAAVTNAPAVP